MLTSILTTLGNIYAKTKTYLVVVLLVIIAYLYSSNLGYKYDIQKQQNTFLEKEHQYKLVIAAHKMASDIAKQELKVAQDKVKETVIKIEKVYVPKVQYVKEFIKETNETDCQAAERLIDSFVY